MTAARTAARTALLDVLDHHGDRGRPAPCRLFPAAGWTEDSAAQETAAELCQGCPALDPCRQYGRAFPREHGVYGGETTTQRQTTKTTERNT